MEVALAAIIASCGTARIRQNLSEQPAEERTPADNKNESNDSNDSVMNEILTEKTVSIKETKEQTSKNRKPHEQDSSDDNVPGTLGYLRTHKFNRRTVLIGPNDTFVSIAYRELAIDHGNLAWLIADINLNRIKETYLDGKRIVEVRTRRDN